MTVTIQQINKYNGEFWPVINLAEVQLFSKGARIPASQLVFTLSSTLSASYPASNCNNGFIFDICHTGALDFSPTLTIYSPSSFDQIIVTNRLDGFQYRIGGATISVSQSGAQLWQSTFVGTQFIYTFNMGMLYKNYTHLYISDYYLFPTFQF